MVKSNFKGRSGGIQFFIIIQTNDPKQVSYPESNKYHRPALLLKTQNTLVSRAVALSVLFITMNMSESYMHCINTDLHTKSADENSPNQKHDVNLSFKKK